MLDDNRQSWGSLHLAKLSGLLFWNFAYQMNFVFFFFIWWISCNLIGQFNKIVQVLRDMDDVSDGAQHLGWKMKMLHKLNAPFFPNNRNGRARISPEVIHSFRKTSTGMCCSICHSNQLSWRMWLNESAGPRNCCNLTRLKFVV